MTIFSEETSLYEILIRVKPDGSWAAHYQNLTEVKKDGVTISAAASDVSPMDMENTEAFSVIQQLIGDAAAKNMVAIAIATKNLEEAEDLIHSLQAKIEELTPETEAGQ